MGLFDSIKHAIFGDHGPLGGGLFGKDHPAPTPAGAPATPPMAQTPQSTPPTAPAAQVLAGQAPAAAQPAPTQSVDVEAILTQKAQAYGKPSNWRTSIVDLLTLLGLESSLSARRELGQELGVHAGADGSAEQNIALHKAVMKKLAENGGKVPADMLD